MSATNFFVPGYWMHETTGTLRPAVQAYLWDLPMSPASISALRAYLRQWINAPAWHGVHGELDVLRAGIDQLTSREAIDDWIELATELGIDPL